VPSDWKEKVKRGEVIAKVVLDWDMENDKEHAASVIGVFRDGGVLIRHADFAKGTATGIENICFLGELNGVCSVKDLHQVGYRTVTVSPLFEHGVVRQRVPKVAELVDDFWNKL
jgi:hypothetical protein